MFYINRNIEVHEAISPNEIDMAIVSIDEDGNPGQINRMVLKAYGYSNDHLPKKKDLVSGYTWMSNDEAKQIIFVVTNGQGAHSGWITKNLSEALEYYTAKIHGRSVWISLMGLTGIGIGYEQSFNLTVSCLQKALVSQREPRTTFMLSIPNDKQGKRLFDKKLIEFPESISEGNEVHNQLKINRAGNKRSFFAAGHDWSGQDQLQKFIEDNIWVNGHKDKQTRIVNSANVGDILFAKATWVKAKSQGMLTLSAVGVVLTNPYDGHQLRVRWFKFPKKINLEIGSQYRSTFQAITENYITDILTEVLTYHPNLPSIIEGLIESEEMETLDIINLIQSNLAQNKNFWWLHARVDKWEIDDLEIGDSEPYRATDSSGKIQRNFHDIEVDDLVFGYQGSPEMTVKGIFQVDHKDLESHVSFKLVYRIEKQPTIEELRKLPNFEQSTINKVRVGSIHPITPAILKEILDSTELSEEKHDENINVQNTAQKTKIDNDGALAPKDFLGFENDIRAFSITLAQKRLVPPVAVALFGNWGTGKSFFMHHLEKNIDHLSEYQGFPKVLPSQKQLDELETKPFCEGVVQIKFNAWSYLDTNLWAGLIANIFEKLDEYVSGENVIEQEKDKAQKIIADKLDIVAHEKENLQTEIQVLTDQKKLAQQKLETMQANKQSIYDNVMEKSIHDLKKEARKQTGAIEETIKEQLDQYGISKQRIDELSPSVLLDELSSWSTFVQNLGRFNKKQLGVGLLILACLVYFVFDPGNYLADFKEKLNLSVVYFFSIAGPVFTKVYQSYSKYKKLLQPVIDYKNKFNEGFDKAKLAYDQSLINLNNQIAANNSDIIEQERKLAEVERKIEDYNHALEHSVTKRAFFDFIRRKANEESYESHLGLISIIRRDFEKLSGLFAEVNIPDNLPVDELREVAIQYNESEDFRKLFNKPLDRIILYIDDLDRCDDDKVLEVLEAVHLLMAFPLFVVVVGVDKRCVSNALRYRNILKYTSKANVSPQELKDDYNIQVIEPEEYLEKIFQIPFRLKAAKPDAIKGLIGNLLKNEIEVQKVKPEEEGTPPAPAEEGNDAAPTSKESGDSKPKPKPPTQAPALVAPEDLLFTQTELKHLQEVSVIVGDTPRTIKRFINIYRIIRAHEQLNYRSKEKDIDFLTIMFVLGLGIGNYRDKSAVFFENCLKQTDKNLKEVLVSSEPSETILPLLEASEVLSQLLTIPADQLNKYVHFVNRFSFN